MKLDSPFFMTKVECPVCGQMNEFENIKAGAYTETERDTDFCPKGIIWTNPEYQKINPLLYFMTTCPNCFYTHEFNQAFKEWKKDSFFVTQRLRSIRERHHQELKQEGSVINRLGEALDPEGHPYESAVIKLLLGIYDERLTEKPNALDLGRYYLRIAWLYRDNQEEKDSTHKTDKLNLTALEKTLRALRVNFGTSEKKIHTLLTSVAVYLPIPVEPKEMGQTAPQPLARYLKGLDKIKEDLSSIQESLDELIEICEESQNKLLASEPENIKTANKVPERPTPEESIGSGKDHLTFTSFLSSLKEVWLEIPLNEWETMKMALGYYQQSYQELKNVTQENQKIQVAYLLAELYRRVGNYQEAESYFEEAKRIGQDFMQKNQDDTNKIALARKIVELAENQGKLSWAKMNSPA